MNHFASVSFWEYYRALSPETRRLADKNFRLLKQNERHPSLQFKKVQTLWSVRVGSDYRALGRDRTNGVQWFWIGNHDDYLHLIGLR